MVQPTPLHKHNVVSGSTYPTVHGSMYTIFYNSFQTVIFKIGQLYLNAHKTHKQLQNDGRLKYPIFYNMPSSPVNRRFCTAATCWITRITNLEEGVVQCAPMVNVPHSPLVKFLTNFYSSTS